MDTLNTSFPCYGSISSINRETENISHQSDRKRSKSIVVLIAVIFSFAIALSILNASTHSMMLEKSEFKKTSKFTWTLYRKSYEPLNYFTSDASTFLYYKTLKHSRYDAIIEPNAPMALFVEDYSEGSEYSYTFQFSTSNAVSSVGTLSTTDDSSIYVSCNPYEEFDVTIKQVSSDGTSFEYTGKALCMYVRREIRSLSEDDLTATMDAMFKLWSTSEEDGQQQYGSDFHNITYLLEMHHFNAAWPDADHFHEGNGFLAQHIKMTNIFEKAMQSVDPSVTVPYWDFTIDSTDGIYPYESPLMSESMFGSMRVPTHSEFFLGFTYSGNNVTDFAILDGRWAFIKSEMNPPKFSELEAGYGYMRSPWNMNPSPYVSRFSGTSPMPNCASHLKMLGYTDMMEFFIEIEVDPHASVHGNNGGKFGCDLFDPLVDSGAMADAQSKMQVCSLWIFSLKALYRKNLIMPSKGCAIPETANDAFCPFTCPEGSEEGIKTSLFNKLVKNEVPEDMTAEQEQQWVDFICGGDAARVFAGDHSESASPSDPSFWPIHPTLERLFHAKMMIGGFETSDWATDTTDTKVCVRHECYEEGVYDSWGDCCYGHYNDSQMLDFTTGLKSSHWGPTNADTILGSDPTSIQYNMPYIYDGFTWDHCGAVKGGDIDTKINLLYHLSQGDAEDDAAVTSDKAADSHSHSDGGEKTKKSKPTNDAAD